MRKNAVAPMLQSSPCTSPPIDFNKIMGAWKDRLPFQVCPQSLVYHTLQKMSNNSFQHKISRIFQQKALDKCGVLTYNRDRKSIPVDGLLPLFQLKRFNRHKFCSSGAVISFSSCDYGCHVFYTMKQ